jgi:phospholipid/cholesterol/gamma-HCH transport system permease protein
MSEARGGDMLQGVAGESGTLHVQLRGDWLLHAPGVPDSAAFLRLLEQAPQAGRIAFDSRALGQWDAKLLVGLNALLKQARVRELEIDASGLPEGVQRLLQLAGAVGEREGARRVAARHGRVKRLGIATLEALASGRELVAFLGELTFSLLRFVRGKAVFDRRDLLLFIEHTGANALPIVSLIAFLVGVIFAFVGIKQLEQFGAGIFVADLVAIAMVREMAAIMTGIIMAGRSGAAFAAQLGTMQVNEEIDALITLGVDPIDYLVLPRLLALVVMTPLLCLYADLMGILGGLLVGVFMLDLNISEYLAMTREAVRLQDFWIGLFHGGVFGVLVALAGCFQGIQCGRSASAVGNAATAAVVTGIVSIIVATALITVICNTLGI